MRFVTIDDSSHIAEIAYVNDKQLMYVKFVSGSVYRYDRVHPDVFGRLVSADSIGAVFSETVRFNSSIRYTAVDDMPGVDDATV